MTSRTQADVLRLTGKPIRISTLPWLSVIRGKLRSRAFRGRAVHAGSFLRRRRIVLDRELEHRPAELVRIVIHELCHFAWVRLGNPRRREWEDLVAAEVRSGVRGELGWSAEVLKNRLRVSDRAARTRRWREYVCESFCDTGAWVFSGLRRHSEFTLAPAARRNRRDWFRASGLIGRLPV